MGVDMERKDELLNLFADESIQKIVAPLIDDLIFIESQLSELRTKPFLRCHPTNPSIQKQTPAARLYKDLLAQQKDIVRILCLQLHKTGEEDNESPLRAYLRELEKE